jgi:glycosyltransferase involved in cell wall biosynthesis
MSLAVSVVIPTFNSEAFLRDTLESIFRQTTLPQEVLIVDDASVDGTCALAQALAGRAPIPTHVIRLDRNTGGPATPLNVGVEQAAGPLVALMDHDDVMYPSKLEVQESCFTDDPALLMAFSDYRVLYSNSSEGDGMSADALRRVMEAGVPRHGFRVLSADSMTRLQLLNSGIVQSCSNLMFRKSVWEAGARFDPRRGAVADYAFKLQVTRRGPVAFVAEPLFKKRVHPANLYHRDPLDQTAFQVYDIVIEVLRQNPKLLVDHTFRYELRRMLLSRAWACRRSGRYGESLHLHWACLRLFGLSRPVVGPLIRFPFAVLHGLLSSA